MFQTKAPTLSEPGALFYLFYHDSGNFLEEIGGRLRKAQCIKAIALRALPRIATFPVFRQPSRDLGQWLGLIARKNI